MQRQNVLRFQWVCDSVASRNVNTHKQWGGGRPDVRSLLPSLNCVISGLVATGAVMFTSAVFICNLKLGLEFKSWTLVVCLVGRTEPALQR